MVGWALEHHHIYNYGPYSVHSVDPDCTIGINGYTGQDYQLIVQQEGQYWRRLTFHKGLLVAIESEW